MKSQLSLLAARYMREQALVIRNSYTGQVSSLHYGGRHLLETHSPGGGCYSVPLWTVAIKDITLRPQSREEIDTKIKHYIKEQRQRWVSSKTYPHQLEHQFIETLSSELSAASPLEQKQHLDDFLTAIKRFISPHTAFGYASSYPWNYELLVASLSDDLMQFPCIDDFTSYPTGGRCHGAIRANNIVYRVTLNVYEINFIKTILSTDHDDKIFADSRPQPEVATSVRYFLCNQLAVEIISAKLVRFLNACGTLKHLISLNQTELHNLLETALDLQKPEIQEAINLQQISVLIGQDYFVDKKYPAVKGEMPLAISTHQEFNRYHLPIYEKFAKHKLSIDKLRLMYFSLMEVIPTLERTEILLQKALNLLTAITHFCTAEEFNDQNMALLKIRYHRLQHQLKKHEISPVTPGNLASKSVALSVLKGFLIALGAVAIVIAFAFLSNPIFVASAGLISVTTGGLGLFKQRHSGNQAQALSNASFAV